MHLRDVNFAVRTLKSIFLCNHYYGYLLFCLFYKYSLFFKEKRDVIIACDYGKAHVLLTPGIGGRLRLNFSCVSYLLSFEDVTPHKLEYHTFVSNINSSL